MSAVRSLSGVNRTWRGQPNSVEIDPSRTLSRADLKAMRGPACGDLEGGGTAQAAVFCPCEAAGLLRDHRRVVERLAKSLSQSWARAIAALAQFLVVFIN